MKRLLLTGGSGTVGKEILKQLLESPSDFEITAFDLKTAASKSLYKNFGKFVNVVYGNISDKDDVAAVCKDKDVVIHLAAIIPPLADRLPQLAKDVNVKGTINLLECLEKLSPEAFFIYSSSISVYGDRNNNPFIKTSDQFKPSDRDEYARTKIEVEELIKKSKLRWTIFRLTAIMGLDNHKPSEIMFHMPLDSHLEIATPSDTGRAFVNSLNYPDILKGNIYNLSGGEKCRIDYFDFLTRSFEIFGLGKPDFADNSFARKNFHCGYYEDGDLLNEILDFRRDTIEDYFANLKKSISPVRKIASGLLRKIIIGNLQRKSEPLAAIRKNNTADIEHFF
jgi:nucleoside-diphosphate-sugar epimerase